VIADVRHKDMYSRVKLVCILLLAILLVAPIILENILGIYRMPLTGWQRPTWILLFFLSSLLLLILPVVTIIRRRSFSRLDGGCWLALVFAWLLYPLSLYGYCHLMNRARNDTWRWTFEGEGVYYFVDSRHPETFAGLINTFPPYISLPKQ
jgi:hypothetical protein